MTLRCNAPERGWPEAKSAFWSDLLLQNLGEMLNQVQYSNDSVVINKEGKPVAVLVDARLFERIRKMQDRLDHIQRRFFNHR